MSQALDLRYAEDWRCALTQAAPAALAQVQQLAYYHPQTLAKHFNAQISQSNVAPHVLQQPAVQQRLTAAVEQWIVRVFGATAQDDFASLVQAQKRIGEIHARVHIPVHAVLRGARAIKAQMLALLGDKAEPSMVALIGNVMDLTMEIMGQAYATSNDQHTQAKEAYRHFALAQNVSTERERRRANLLHWENQVLFAYATGLPAAQVQPLAQSDFGLWFRHKGAHIFQGTPECSTILQTIHTIDQQHLPVVLGQAIAPAERMRWLQTLRDDTRCIAFLLDAVFEQSGALESGRDVLTRLLNRKFLPVVLTKEVSYAQQGGHSFSVLSIDLDHFKRINDTYGHEAGDIVLQQVATLLSQHSRGGDYLFRLGGEEFALVLVNTTSEQARRVAEKLRQQVAMEPIHLPGQQSLHITVSIGVATYDGHPDYQSLLRRADAALYQAKHQGRDQVAVAAAA